MSFNDDPYQILNLKRDADLDDLEKAFRRLALIHHPDKSKGIPGSAEQYAHITAAYTYLKNVLSSSGMEFQDGRGAQGGFGGSQKQSILSGRCVKVTISFKESVTGTSRCVKIKKNKIFKSSKKVTVQIPSGTGDRALLRVPEAGFPVFPQEPPSDLLVQVRVRKDRRFSCVGADIHTNMPVSKRLLKKGGRITVTIPAGKTVVKVPPRTEPATVFRLKGLGFPASDVFSTGGDFYVKLLPRSGFLRRIFRFFRSPDTDRKNPDRNEDPFWRLHSLND